MNKKDNRRNHLLDAALLPPRAEKSQNIEINLYFSNEHIKDLPLISESEPCRPALRRRRASLLLK